jgi:hypothetical protein
MERVLTTDELILIEAVKVSIGWGRIVENNSVAGIYNLLKISPDNDEEIDTVDSFLRGDLKIMDMVRKLKVEIRDGQEDQRVPEGESGGEGTEGGTEQDPWDDDETN